MPQQFFEENTPQVSFLPARARGDWPDALTYREAVGCLAPDGAAPEVAEATADTDQLGL